MSALSRPSSTSALDTSIPADSVPTSPTLGLDLDEIDSDEFDMADLMTEPVPEIATDPPRSSIHDPSSSSFQTLILSTPLSRPANHTSIPTPTPIIPLVTDTPIIDSPPLHTSSLIKELGFYTPGFHHLDSGPIFDHTFFHAVVDTETLIRSSPATDIASTLSKPFRARTYVRHRGQGRHVPSRPTRTHLHDLRSMWPRSRASTDTGPIEIGSSNDEDSA